MFLTGPGVVREALGEEIDAAGARRAAGARPQRRLPPGRERRGSAAAARARAARPTCPRAPARRPPRGRRRCDAAARRSRAGRPDRAAPRLRRPRRAARDRRRATRCSSSRPRWARNVVTTLARIDGRPVGDRRQPAALPRRRARRRRLGEGGLVRAACATRSALPLLAVVDTPGFMPGSKQEQAGVIRHGASLVRAFAAARVPKLTVVLRKSYGGAYITMNSRDLGADLVLAWPTAELGIMSARAAVGDRQPARAARGGGPRGRARRGSRRPTRTSTCAPTRRRPAGSSTRSSSPSQTRERLAWALQTLAGGPGHPRCARDPGRQAAADHRRHHEGLDRVPRRAERAQQEGAEVLLTSFGRVRRMTERAAQRLPQPVDVLELDVNRAGGPRGADASRCASAGAASTASCTRSRSRPRTRSAASS